MKGVIKNFANWTAALTLLVALLIGVLLYPLVAMLSGLRGKDMGGKKK